MKKFFAAMIVLLMMNVQGEAITCEDSTFAVDTINQKLREWKCTPLRIQYGGDELNNAENVAYMNELAEARGFEKKFSAWNYDSEYKKN